MKRLLLPSVLVLAQALFAGEPAPSYRDPSLPIPQRVDDLMRRMTPEEKVAQLTCVIFSGFDGATPDERIAKLAAYAHVGMGMMALPSEWADSPQGIAEVDNKIHELFRSRSRLGIPILLHEEGAHGYVASGATSFPIPPALASTWDPALVRQAFTIAGREAALCGTDLVFTPVLDLARDPRWGRTEETYGEDPWLVAQMGLACVMGYQGDAAPLLGRLHVAATLKHYTAHGSPESGINISPAREDFHTIADVQQLPFKICVQQGRVMDVMAAYSEVDGVPMHTNKYYLDDVLRRQWGFSGVVVSDWYGVEVLYDVHHTVHSKAEAAIKALAAGVDLETPDQVTYPTLLTSLAEGRVSPAYIDRSVRRVLTMKFQLGLFEKPPVDPAEAGRVVGDAEARATARRVAEEAIVLLKNEGALLPLDPAKLGTLALIGPEVAVAETGGYSGTPRSKVTLLEGVRRALRGRANLLTAEGVRLAQPLTAKNDDDVRPPDPAVNAGLIAAAVEVARKADVVVLCLGQNHFMAREAWAPYHRGDNASLELRAQQDDLVRAIRRTGKPVVVALFNGSPLAFESISRDVPAILECWYLGQEAGDAFAGVLFGTVNPSGKLPVTLARSVGQLPVFYNHKPSSRTRGYVLDDDRPLYPFGFGLSYTTFSYAHLAVRPLADRSAAMAKVSVDVTNTGRVAGRETVEMYVHQQVSSLTRPVKELRDFAKIELQPGETRTVEFAITPEKLAFHDAGMRFVVEPGDFDIMVGSSSEELQTAVLTVDREIELPQQ
jgi:beta-glucosidase